MSSSTASDDERVAQQLQEADAILQQHALRLQTMILLTWSRLCCFFSTFVWVFFLIRGGNFDRGNYMTDEQFDDSYESLLALGERIGDAKPKVSMRKSSKDWSTNGLQK